MVPVLEFYEKIPPKTCCSCGTVIEEQHESYAMECERCINTQGE